MAYSYPENEADFVDKVTSDLILFIESSPVDSVLVFPPVNSFYRFLIHQLAKDSFDQLRTFSIGEDPARRIVVCTKDLIARIDASKDEPQASVRSIETPSDLTMVVSDAEKTNSAQARKSRSSLPTIGIYRPPAARKLKEDSSKCIVGSGPDPTIVDTSAKNEVTPARARVRRPDLQVYVPRAKRGFRNSERLKDASAPSLDNNTSSRFSNSPINDPPVREKSRSGSNLILDDKKSSKQRSLSPSGASLSLPPRASHLVETKKKLCQSSSSDLDLEGIDSRVPVESERLSSTMSSILPGNLPPRVEVLVEKKKKLCQSISLSEDYRWKTKENDDQDINFNISHNIAAESELHSSVSCSELKNPPADSDSEMASVIDLQVSGTDTISEVKEECDIVKVESTASVVKSSSTVSERTFNTSEPSTIIITDDKCVSPSSKFVQGPESSDDDYQDAHNEEKRSCLTNMSDGSDGGSSESLSSSDSLNSHVSPVQLMKPVKSEPKKKSSPTKPSRVFNPDECDWDALLDEDGDVLDPFLMKELTSTVGQVQVTQPKSDYRNYRSQVSTDHHRSRRSAGDDDFGHVVEIYSFPPEFKTNDLVAVLSPFKNTAGGFEIKWVDDTHALGVFASTLIAEQVLAYQHPMIRTRPLCEATLESRLKARKLSESIQSFRPRPETCAALARRLVTGALGVKLPTARQEREEEKRVLREAREKRRLAVQQQDDIWNS